MFELNENIKKWHGELIANQSMNEANADELISHLKDNIEELTSKGLSKEESYWIARHRLGDTQALSMEFTKINRALFWRNRLLWLLFGYFLFTTISSLVKILTIPLHLLDAKWLLFKNPLMGDHFTSPIPLFLLILLIFLGIFYVMTSQKDIFKRNEPYHLNFISRFKIGYGFIFAFLGISLIINFSCYLSNIVVARIIGPSAIGIITASTQVFSFLWNIFLFVALIICAFLALKPKNEIVNN